jgi:hypothetical protein
MNDGGKIASANPRGVRGFELQKSCAMTDDRIVTPKVSAGPPGAQLVGNAY